MNADAFFVIGKTHDICQDYALAGPFSREKKLIGNPRIALSDGCSSSPSSDFGSRFLVRAAEEVGNDPLAIINTAQVYCRALNMPLDCLCATLLTAEVKDEAFHCSVSGDGVMVVRRRDTKSYLVYVHEYPSGAPYYLRYLLDERSLKAYQDQFGFTRKISIYMIGESGNLVLLETLTRDSAEESVTEIGRWPLNDYDMVAMFTDGVHSFMKTVTTATDKVEQQVPYMDVLKELLQFKNYNGCFVQRRMRRAFDPTLGMFGKNGWANMDDLSVGVIISS